MILKKIIVALLLIFATGFDALLFAISYSENNLQGIGIMGMGLGTLFVWVWIGGALMLRYRDKIASYVRGLSYAWQVKFVVFATVLALVEEMVTTLMTNLAPMFGTTPEIAHITASTNYFDVVLFHSVIVIAPLFIAWAIILKHYDFKPFSIFLLFGVMGIIAEASLAGPAIALAGFAQWILIYGLMIYLPAYSLPTRATAKPVRWYMYLLAVPAIFLIALTMIIPIVLIITQVLHHPGMHY